MAAASNSLGFHGFRMSALACVALVVSIATLVAACGPVDESSYGVPTTGSGGGGEGGGGNGGEAGDGGTGGVACPEGTTRSCKVDLGTHGNVTSCFQGEQRCEDGAWGPCVEPSGMPAPPPAAVRRDPRRPEIGLAPARRPAIAPAPDLHTMSLSTPVACGTDPCDPSCQTFDEVPGTPIGSPPEILIAPWNTGNYGDLPPNVASQGTSEPCSKGSDCQFDQYCYNPTSGICAHSKCVLGGGLNASCDTCVAAVCGADPSCCNTPLGTTGASTCAHDLCVTGAPLKNSPTTCDPCVATICADAKYSFCCNQVSGQWTQECVNQVAALCGKSCATGSWTQGCVDLVKTQCGAFCLEDEAAPICAHDKCLLGGPLTAACDPCVADICAADPFCCSGGWDGKCLQEVAGICGLTCPAQGDCQPWLPTQVDPSCASIDLTVGVGCTTAGGGKQVPVCNHGNAVAPAGIPVVVYPPSPPDVIPNGAYGGEPFVATTEAINPGDCIDVKLPDATADGSQIGVNRNGAPGYNNSECQESNNWSVWSSATGACETPSCAGASASAKLKKVKLFMTVDKSLSQTFVMTGLPGTPTRWQELTKALKAFITDPTSDDIGVWLRFWPHNVNGACPTPYPAGCGSATGCKTPNADVPDLTTAPVDNETPLLTAINAITPSGNTPMFPALEGALQAAAEFQQANPDYVAAVVMVTDGNPSQCTTSLSGVSNLSASYYNGYGIRSYIIGIAEVSQTFCEVVAGAGGGKSFFIDAGANVQIQQQMVAALNSIKQDFISCSLSLPNQNIFDPAGATFTYTPGVGAPITLMDVGTAAGCGAGDGWYYDNPADPTSITLCPATCTAVKADPNAELELSIDCISQYEPYDPPVETYEAVCPPGTVPQWGFLAYDTTTPGDSKVEFRVSTSADGITYGALPALPTATATSAAEDCLMGGPAPCPVSLYTALGGLPDAHEKYLQLAIKIFPTSDQNQTPQVHNWEVTYSCPDAE